MAVRFVEHTRPAAAASPYEAEAVAALWRSLQGVGWTDAEGERHIIGANDVLVVAPYDNRVALVRGLLSNGALVGTVDKLQGREAPVGLDSRTSTSGGDAPPRRLVPL